jgi:uncharacterized protein
VKVLARQPGTKESRYVHLMSGDVEDSAPDAVRASAAAATGGEPLDNGRILRLESEIAALRNEIAELTRQFAQFRKQFE